MPSSVRFPDSFLLRVQRLQGASMDAGKEIMPELERLAWEDNRDGLLAGKDKDGQRFAPLAASTLKYRKGTGPPLIPNRTRSRMIANYGVTSFRRSDGNWVILGAWRNVLSKKGVPFIPFHADGTRFMARRDLVGVRPEGKRKIGAALTQWLLSKWGKP